MAAGQGWSFHFYSAFVHEGHADLIRRQIYWARYIDWAITSPLILLDLTLLAGLPGAQILFVIVTDVAMILFVRAPLYSQLLR